MVVSATGMANNTLANNIFVIFVILALSCLINKSLGTSVEVIDTNLVFIRSSNSLTGLI